MAAAPIPTHMYVHELYSVSVYRFQKKKSSNKTSSVYNPNVQNTATCTALYIHATQLDQARRTLIHSSTFNSLCPKVRASALPNAVGTAYARKGVGALKDDMVVEGGWGGWVGGGGEGD